MGLKILDKDVELFRDLIHRKSGIYLEGNRLDALRAGLYTRMESRGTTPSQYYSFLYSHPEGRRELEELLSYITVNETYFFRNAAHFAVLRDRILAKLIKENKEGIIRIWSAGCSTGEEPYSIAMTALDILQGREDLPIEILGTDVDKQALTKAERGIYKERTLRVTEEKYRNRYFGSPNTMNSNLVPTSTGIPEIPRTRRPESREFEIDERVKDIVQFEPFNLMETSYPKPSVGNWDIVFCRNVVIYFDRESVRHVVSSFHSVLADDGYLFMGHSETLDGISDEFSPIEMDDAFVYVKKQYNAEKARRPESRKASLPGDVKNTRGTATSKKQLSGRRAQGGEWVSSHSATRDRELLEDAESIYRKASELFAGEQFDAALTEIEIYTGLMPEDARGHLLAGRIYADRGMYERAVHELERAIELESLLAEAHYLLGIIYRILGQMTRAISEFRRAVYVDKDFVLPYFSLACALRNDSQKSDAIREFRNAVRILGKLQDDEIIQLSGGLTGRLLAQICLKNIEELSD